MKVKKFEPRRLRLARTFLGLAQGELGERVGASRQFIHQLESSVRVPNNEMVAALAAALLVEAAFFFRLPEDEIAQESCNFRKLASTRVRDMEQVIAHGTLLAELVKLLEDVLDFPVSNFPHVKVRDDDDIERAAERARLHWGLTVDRPILSTIRVAESAGAVVVKFPGVASEIDALSICGDRHLIIRSSEKESPTRLRFDIAHEIGHLIMHQAGQRPEHDEAERQAHRFASAFLLPRRAFIREFPPGRRLDWHAIFAIKRTWKVSAQAILRRAHDLGLIDAAQYRSGNVFIAKQGFKRNEPYEPSESEQPEVLRTALIALEKTSKMLPKDVAHALAIQPVLLGKLLGVSMPEPTDADARTIVSLNARMEWSKIKWAQ